MKHKLTIGILLLTFTVCGAFVIKQFRGLGFNTGYAPTQPEIQYSHKLHAGDYKIPCMYCHFAADKGRHAGIPPMELCLNCHSQIQTENPQIQKLAKAVEEGKTIEWTKVHHLPDFVYFNHSQHVRVGKLKCQECHGAVETMEVLKQEKTLAMGWCLDCHRKKEIAAPADHKSASGGDCSKCHY